MTQAATPRPRQRRIESEPVRSIHQGTIEVERTNYGIEHHEIERISVPLFATHPARVSVAGGVTRQLAGMEFARIDVRVELPCLPEISEIERVSAICEGIVRRKIAEQDQNLGPVAGAPTGITRTA